MRFLFIAITIVMMTGSCTEEKKLPAAPVAEKIPKDVGMHGDKRIDDYYWMNDYFKKGPLSDKVVEYLKEENKYTDTVLGDIRGLRDTLFNEMKARIMENDQSVPVIDNGYYYYNRYEEGKQYPINCRKKGSLEAPEEIMLDQNKMAE